MAPQRTDAGGFPVNISRALAISGWMLEPELRWLAEHASERRFIVEIGSYLGRSTRALADNTSGVVMAVDDFRGPRDTYIPEEERASILEHFKKNTQDLLDSGRLLLAVQDHRIPIDCSPDMVFIDGSHDYEDVYADVSQWWPKLRAGGLLCGHDYYRPDVTQAVKELVSEYRLVSGTGLWWREK